MLGPPTAPVWGAARHVLLAALFAIVAIAILISPLGRDAQPTYNFIVGDVAPADISAPTLDHLHKFHSNHCATAKCNRSG